MYKAVLVLSIAFWAITVAMLISKPSDVRRTIQLLSDVRATATPPRPSYPGSSTARRRQDPLRGVPRISRKAS